MKQSNMINAPHHQPSLSAPGETIPLEELTRRHAAVRSAMQARFPQAEGFLVLGLQSLYYCAGTLPAGVLWLPLEGEPVLAVRKGLPRVRLESPLKTLAAYRSFKDLEGICREAGSPLGRCIATDKSGLGWDQGLLLEARLPGRELLDGSSALARARSRKSLWELARLREAGKRHNQVLRHMLPERIRPGMSELAIAHALWDCCFEVGHAGALPTGMPGLGLFLGNVSAGENGNYPTAYNGPLGLKGMHPAAPAMGNALCLWEKDMVLSIDIGFNYEGYLTDKTEIYYSGPHKALSPRIEKAENTALAIERMAASMLRPGVRPSAIYAESLRLAAEAGFSKEFMGLDDNQVPFLGHGCGLNVSEFPILARGFEEPLEEGMVIALEPKIGLRGIGMVGVENTYEITAQGARCLTGDARGIICLP